MHNTIVMAASLVAPKPKPVSPSWPSIEVEEMENARLQSRFEDSIRDLSPYRGYKHVAVLLLYWDKVFDSYLDSQAEVSNAAPSMIIFNTSSGRTVEVCLRRSVSFQSLPAQPQPCRRQEQGAQTPFA